MRLAVPFLCVSLLFLGVSSALSLKHKQGPPPLKTISFNRDVRPILSESCYKCHGPDGKEAKADLRLDLRENSIKDRDGHQVIAPGKPDLSHLIKRVTGKGGRIMPPKNSGMKELTEEQVAILRQWISEGAKYEAHWAFIPPQKSILPQVKNTTWAKNRIDHFIMEGLEKKGMKPEPEADKSTLLRRASLTLTGLPPSPSELQTFLADKSPNAYEKQVDRLLASPRYGEHQARFWLDAVRYGDSHGLHLDNERSIYPYRDWVVRAFNQDLPYSQFILWQMAGDMLPNPTQEMKIATGYIRMNPTTAEGGAIEEEVLAKNTFDRVDTTSTVLLGLTVACARCHDHKYDPITHKDYFQLYAFFNSTADAPLDGNLLSPEPSMKVPTPEEAKRIDLLKKRIAAINGEVSDATAKSWVEANYVPPPTFGAWEKSALYVAKTFDEAFDEVSEPEKGGGTWTKVDFAPGQNIAIVGKESASAYLRTTIQSASSKSFTIRLSSDDGNKVWLNGALVHSNRVARGINQGVDLVVLPLKEGSNSLLIKLVNGVGGDEIRYQLGDERWAFIQTALSSGGAKTAYLNFGPNTLPALRFRSLTKELAKLEASIPSTLIAKEMDKPRKSFILRRGEYNLPTEEVGRDIPKVLGGLPPGYPRNRLGLAKWIADTKNPLATRVWVNRVWQQHFGTGLVKTSEDFGNQGEWPSHPELLDDLAVTFVEEGSSLKKLHRKILTSAAFRQSAATSEAKRTADPENRLISRGPRFRLDGEVIRDSVLAASGKLQEYKGGRGFRPYQPDGLWEALGFPESTTSRYVQDKDAGIYRRSLYMFWKRTSPHPVMLTFDAPMRESCSVRRSRTNTPLQALVTLNEPTFVEASRNFATRIIKAKSGDKDRLDFAFRSLVGRKPTDAEQRVLLASLARYRERYLLRQEDAVKLLSIGMSPRDKSIPPVEAAAWTLLASTLFNLDEFLTQH